MTLDADFHALLALSGATGPSVVRIRIEGQRAEGLVTLLVNVLRVCKDDLVQGAMISVTENGGLEGFLSCDKLFRRDCARNQLLIGDSPQRLSLSTSWRTRGERSLKKGAPQIPPTVIVKVMIII